MLLFTVISRKIYKNKGLYSFLLLGIVILTMLMSSIPMFTEGLLNRLLTSDLEEYQKSTLQYPGNYTVIYKVSNKELDRAYSNLPYGDESSTNPGIMSVYKKRQEQIETLQEISKKSIVSNFDVPVTSNLISYSLEGRYIRESDKNNLNQYIYHGYGYLRSIENIEKHINVLSGNLPSNKLIGNVYEIMLTQNILDKYQFELNKIYELTDVRENGVTPIKIKPVCVFSMQNEDVFWTGINKEEIISDSFIINNELMRDNFISKDPCLVGSVKWNYAFDYHVFNIRNLSSFVSGCKTNDEILKAISSQITTNNSIENITPKYYDKKIRMELMLWTLYAPVIIMLLLYLLMLCNTITEREKNEIAVLNSRGATRLQIVFNYFIQGAFLSLISIIIAPPLAKALTGVLGSTTQFLKFDNREKLDTNLSIESYLYGFAAIIVFLIIFMFYIFINSKVNIVSHKRKNARKQKAAIWQKLYPDLAMLLIVAFGYDSFLKKMDKAAISGSFAGKGDFDPLLFLIPVLFVLGVFLIFLRIYPRIIELICKLGKSFWPPKIYITLIQVSRSIYRYHFIMIFLALTISIGLFSSISIRTINTNSQERILYKNGADIVISYSWDVIPQGEKAEQTLSSGEYKPIFDEPDFEKYKKLPEAKSVSKVFTSRGCTVKKNLEETKNIDVMGIESESFSNTAWFIDGLLPNDFEKYVSLLNNSDNSCIVSNSLSSAAGLKIGDTIEFNPMNEPPIKLIVRGIVNYWPTFNPNKLSLSNNSLQKLIITDLGMLQNNYGLKPYDVWLNLRNENSYKNIENSLRQNNIRYTSIKNSGEEVYRSMTDPYQTAINGAFSFGFIICGLICILGFLLFWMLEIKSRTIQYGVFRAIGLNTDDIIQILAWEQQLTSIITIFCGTVIGIITSYLFVPFFKISYDVSALVPPFIIKVLPFDIINIMVFSLSAIVILFVILIIMVHKFKIDRALKLGED